MRAFEAVGGHPRFIDCGEGAYMVDVDGHRYVDHVMSWNGNSRVNMIPSYTRMSFVLKDAELYSFRLADEV